MKTLVLHIVMLWLLSMILPELQAQPTTNKTVLSGYVRDASNGEALIQATILVKELKTGAYTNNYGFYSLSLPAGSYTIQVSYLGFEIASQVVDLDNSKSINFELSPEAISTDEVVITAEAEDQNVSKNQMSVIRMDIQEIKRMPQLMGEVDIIRSIQLMPGVSSVGEGSSGFNVRGGNTDQNLILLDEAPVYNSSHLMGFFSIFNADAIKDVQLYKGGIPARYGGRLSSVLEVRQKEGNSKRLGGSAGIGLLSSKLSIEAPIAQQKGSFMLAGRRSYMDLFLKMSPDSSINQNQLFFYDLNTKVNYEINEKNRIFLSGYFGDDVFGFKNEFKMKWGNKAGTLRWNHLFNDRVFANFTGVYSNYQYALSIEPGADNAAFHWKSNIVNYVAKTDIGWYVNPQLMIETGVGVTFHEFRPGDVDFTEEDKGFEDFLIDHQHALETHAYLSAEQKVTNRLSLQYGLRYTGFGNYGKGDVYVYDEALPKRRSSIIDTISYDKGKLIEQYHSLEPRLSMTYLVDDNSSVKASYNRVKQFAHLISNANSPTPLDIWMPSGAHIKPAIVDQVAIGYFRNFDKNTWETSAEVYYKKLGQLVDYRDGAELIFNSTLETELLSGKGRAYGLEVSINKRKGRFTGRLGYTLSRSERQVEGINNNQYYLANVDKTHDLSLVLNYKLNKRWDISSNFAYMTGKPFTYIDAKYQYDGRTVPNYGNRNGSRMPDYHRLDLSANCALSQGKDTRVEKSLSFGVYNAYGRKNPYSIYFQQNKDNPLKMDAKQMSIFAIPIPFISYNLSF